MTNYPVKKELDSFLEDIEDTIVGKVKYSFLSLVYELFKRFIVLSISKSMFEKVYLSTE